MSSDVWASYKSKKKEAAKAQRKKLAEERLATAPNCAQPECPHKAIQRGFCLPHYNAQKPKLTAAEEMMKVSKLDDDYLTSIAEKPATAKDKIAQTKNYTEIQMFCIANYIKPGTSLIHIKLVIELYLQWSGKESIETKEISYHFDKWFTKNIISKEIYYSLELQPFLQLLDQNLGYLKESRYVYTGKR
jgi:hypothetical protein